MHKTMILQRRMCDGFIEKPLPCFINKEILKRERKKERKKELILGNRHRKNFLITPEITFQQ
jgi:hypothetical protein